MNQILVVGNKNGKNNNSTVDIKKIIIFFCIAIIVFGAILIISGVVGLNKNNKKGDTTDDKGGAPIVGEEPTQEPPSDDDNERPTIDLSVSGENIKIVARDETELDYIEYNRNDGEWTKVEADPENKNKIETTITLEPGMNVIKVRAVDKAGNDQERTDEFKGEIRPTVQLFINEEGNGVIIQAECADGISKLAYTQNGKWTEIRFSENPDATVEDWASVNVTVRLSDDGKIVYAEYTQPLVEGENIFNAYAYNLNGLPGSKKATTTYPAE